ncbi:hypothetical protein [Dyella sp.]|uniref:hypothetical protein n=1 Tax=Dyella sp. TaxID=1869338 RepID=UPI002ED30B3E
MGSARWNPSDWDRYAASTSSKSRGAIFASRGMHAALDPKNITLRESVDSDLNPQSTPIIVALDVTGSMGSIPEALIKGSLGTFIDEVYHRKPVTDPHLMFMGVGDAFFDRAPLQVTQFEADLRIAEQLSSIYLEGGGGGNASESYHLPWYFAGVRTKTDSIAKRNTKGYLFTVGDEQVPPALTVAQAQAIFGDDIERDYSPADLLALAERYYHVFHIIVEQGNACSSPASRDAVFDSWHHLMGQRVIPLSDYTRLSEVLVSTIQANEGAHAADVAASWTGDTALVVRRALAGLPSPTAGATPALTRF